MSKSISLNQKAWMRFKRNKVAMFGLCVIVASLFIAIFAYQLAPDNTPDANEQNLPLAMMPPGFSILMLDIYKPAPGAERRTKWQNFFQGTPTPYEAVPILSKRRLRVDSMYVPVFKGKGRPSEERKYAYMDILNPDSIFIVSPSVNIKPHPHRGMIYVPAYKNQGGGGFAQGSRKPVTLAEIKSDTAAYKVFCTYIRNLVYTTSAIQKTYWLGTDRFGRDILSRLIIGSRISLFVGLVSVLISLIIGVVMGALAGYFRGWVDAVILWVINVFWSIPTILLAMGLYVGAGTIIPSKLLLIFIAVGLTMWVEVARIVRGQFILVREMEYVTAAQSMGFGHVRTIFRHILPNVLGPIIVVACANFANAILIESGLSYIGLGVQPPTPSWGGMLSEYKNFIDSDKAFLALSPGIAIMILVLAFNLVGNGLRDALDVKGKAE